MNREIFIEKWHPGIVTTNGTFKSKEWLLDFYAVLADEKEETMKMVNETLDKLK